MTEIWLLLSGLTLLLIVLGVFNYRLSQRLSAVEQHNQRLNEKMRQEMAALNSAAIGVGQRLISAEKKLKQAVEHSESKTFNNADIDSSVSAAIATGTDLSAQELSDRYGLSEAEANLMVLLKMHGAERSTV